GRLPDPRRQLHASRGAGSPRAEGGRAAGTVHLRPAAPCIRDPRTSDDGCRGVDHL
ncbi:MAG: hypothetical protein AVDCRST_MAG67-2624, partial [uncultured Solirubrobacteraceae bacterium]